MSQDEFEQTVMQELREREERYPEPFTTDWFMRFEILGSELKQVKGDNNDK